MVYPNSMVLRWQFWKCSLDVTASLSTAAMEHCRSGVEGLHDTSTTRDISLRTKHSDCVAYLRTHTSYSRLTLRSGEGAKQNCMHKVRSQILLSPKNVLIRHSPASQATARAFDKHSALFVTKSGLGEFDVGLQYASLNVTVQINPSGRASPSQSVAAFRTSVSERHTSLPYSGSECSNARV